MGINFYQISSGNEYCNAVDNSSANRATDTTASTQSTSSNIKIPPKGTNSLVVLSRAPKPDVVINGEKRNATIVVDLSKNVLYKYDQNGKPQMAYLIASGKKSTPTNTGIRVISHVESYPYKYAPPTTKRRKTPGAFGPRALILRVVNPADGSTSQTGEFIHGNSDPSSIGKYVSNGCMRMDNEVIVTLSKQVKSGDIVVIK